MSIGRTLVASSLMLSLGPNDAAIIGDDSGEPFAALRLTSGQWLSTGTLAAGESGDAGNLPAFTIEAWVQPTANPSVTRTIIAGPTTVASGVRQYFVQMLTTGFVRFLFRESGGGTPSMDSTSVLPLNVWTHLVCAYGANIQRIYMNGVQINQAASGGTPYPDISATNGTFFVGDAAGTTHTMYMDEIAFYRYELPAARVLAHYQAGRERGYPEQAPGARVAAVLEDSSSQAAQSLGAGVRTLTARYQRGQTPLDEIRSARAAEAVDAVFFTARDGTLTFLDSAHRSSSPYNTVQATFDDDGTDLPYENLTYSPATDSFIANTWTVTRVGPLAATQEASDATSVSRYYERPRSLTGVPVTTDGQASTIATAMLAKYKEPMARITSLSLSTAEPAVAEAVFRRDIGDRIRVLRTTPGGGSRIDQTLFIQKITVDAKPGEPWKVTWAVSPV